WRRQRRRRSQRRGGRIAACAFGNSFARIRSMIPVPRQNRNSKLSRTGKQSTFRSARQSVPEIQQMTRARHMPLVALVAATLCAISVLTGSAHAAFPDRPIRLIVSFPPGGASDGVARIVAEGLSYRLRGPGVVGDQSRAARTRAARLVAEGLSYRLGVPVVVENQGGAAGTIAGAMVARAAPDGYTMLVSATAVFAMVPNLRKLDFDPLHDLLPVARIGESLRALAVSPKLPVKTLAEFIAYAKQNPGKLNYGSSGQGSPVHILTESF